MIEAIETKCFNLDKDLDHIRVALQGAHIVVEASSRIGVKTISPENNTTSGDEDLKERYSSPEEARESSPENPPSLVSPLKTLGISPETLKASGGAKNSKIIKLALVKSIDKYKEMRNRLEAVER